MKQIFILDNYVQRSTRSVPACRSEAEIPHLRGWSDFFENESNNIRKIFCLKKIRSSKLLHSLWNDLNVIKVQWPLVHTETPAPLLRQIFKGLFLFSQPDDIRTPLDSQFLPSKRDAV